MHTILRIKPLSDNKQNQTFMKKIMLVCSLVLFIVSCTTDSVENTNAVVTGYKYTSTSDFSDPAIPDYSSVVIGNLLNGKLYSETTEEFSNGVSQGAAVTEQRFFYSNNLLEHRVMSDKTVYYYYDTNSNLIGATGVFPATPTSPAGYIYERYVHQPNNVVFCEHISLPYNDPNAVAGNRRILQLDANGNVISGGEDFDMDGVATNIYSYTYSNDNLVAMQKPDGTIVSFSYSTVIDTYGHLEKLSCGKQVLQFPCAFVFTDGIPAAIVSLPKYSKNVSSDEFLASVYQLMPDGFYNKRTTSNPSSFGSHTEEMEFFFN